MMKAWLQGAVGAALLLLCGCQRTSFTEGDLGSTVTLDQGSDFTVSLPRAQSGDRKAPDIRGALIRLLDRRVDAGSNQEVFHFMAEGVGDAEIRIAGKDQTIPEFVMLVQVMRIAKPGSSPYSAESRPPGY